MSYLRPFSATDLFRFNNINFDAWTETVRCSFRLYCNRELIPCIIPVLGLVLPEQPRKLARSVFRPRRTRWDAHGIWLFSFFSVRSNQSFADCRNINTVMAKTEGQGKDWQLRLAHCAVFPFFSSDGILKIYLAYCSGHVTAITVSPSYRRIGLAKGMMVLLEKMSGLADAWFVDLYVRVSNERTYTFTPLSPLCKGGGEGGEPPFPSPVS
jgi:hypothetical protein